mmetsp:Transcript_27584/g.64338  ORF Transcript_27584/g.64338 Transcript_27584/m.64338 type:complete len:305 (-) Transcript_27584:548-1462(-)
MASAAALAARASSSRPRASASSSSMSSALAAPDCAVLSWACSLDASARADSSLRFATATSFSASPSCACSDATFAWSCAASPSASSTCPRTLCSAAAAASRARSSPCAVLRRSSCLFSSSRRFVLAIVSSISAKRCCSEAREALRNSTLLFNWRIRASDCADRAAMVDSPSRTISPCATSREVAAWNDCCNTRNSDRRVSASSSAFCRRPSAPDSRCAAADRCCRASLSSVRREFVWSSKASTFAASSLSRLRCSDMACCISVAASDAIRRFSAWCSRTVSSSSFPSSCTRAMRCFVWAASSPV